MSSPVLAAFYSHLLYQTERNGVVGGFFFPRTHTHQELLRDELHDQLLRPVLRVPAIIKTHQINEDETPVKVLMTSQHHSERFKQAHDGREFPLGGASFNNNV